jgi:DNA-binding NarL/FixJ family response regulator
MSAGSSAGAPLRVLIIDDQPVFRRAARELLEARGYSVVGEAGCAAAALEGAKQLEPDAVLLVSCTDPGTATSTPGRAVLEGSRSRAGSR